MRQLVRIHSTPDNRLHRCFKQDSGYGGLGLVAVVPQDLTDEVQSAIKSTCGFCSCYSRAAGFKMYVVLGFLLVKIF
jgi:hypothetical protein